MAAIDLLSQSGTQMLGTRPTARAMKPAILAQLRACTNDGAGAGENGAITFDTSGIRRISVSFFDECLLILSELMSETGDDNLRLIYHKAPSPESLKNLAANRGLTVSESPDGDWIISSRR